MTISVCIFDLDDCLYRSDLIHVIVRNNIAAFLHQRLGLPKDEAKKLGPALTAEYGSTLAGIAATGHKVDYDEWYAFINGTIDYEAMLQPDPELRAVLMAIDLPKHIFTNADHVHAERCLARLGIRDCFEHVYDFEKLHEIAHKRGLVTEARPVMSKPLALAFEVVLHDLGVTAAEAMFADDRGGNVTAAHDLGMKTVYVGSNTLPEGVRADVAVATLHQLPQAMPSLMMGGRATPKALGTTDTVVSEAGTLIGVTAA